MAVSIIIKKYEHINSSLGNWDTPRGKYISSRKQYYDELSRQRFVPYEEGQRLSESKSKESKWIPSADLRSKLTYIKGKCDSKGNIRHPNDLIGLYKDSGVKLEFPKWLPKHYSEEGGFENAA